MPTPSPAAQCMSIPTLDASLPLPIVRARLATAEDAKERAHHEDQLDQRTSAMDQHGLGLTLGGRRLDDADPYIGFDETGDRVEAAQLHAQSKTLTDPPRLLGQKALYNFPGPDRLTVPRVTGHGRPTRGSRSRQGPTRSASGRVSADSFQRNGRAAAPPRLR